MAIWCVAAVLVAGCVSNTSSVAEVAIVSVEPKATTAKVGTLVPVQITVRNDGRAPEVVSLSLAQPLNPGFSVPHAEAKASIPAQSSRDVLLYVCQAHPTTLEYAPGILARGTHNWHAETMGFSITYTGASSFCPDADAAGNGDIEATKISFADREPPRAGQRFLVSVEIENHGYSGPFDVAVRTLGTIVGDAREEIDRRTAVTNALVWVTIEEPGKYDLHAEIAPGRVTAPPYTVDVG